MTLSVPKLIDQAFRARGPKQWPAFDGTMLDRRLYVSASEIAYCARRIVYEKTFDGSPQGGDESYGFAQRGHTAEAWMIDQLRSSQEQVALLYEGDKQRSFYYGKQSGTPDGILHDYLDYFLLEFKCVDPRTSRKNLPKSAHKDQCIQNMDLIYKCLDIEIDEARLIYIDASNYEDITEYTVKFDPDRADQLTARAETIMSYASPEEAPPEGVYNGDCKYCKFKSLCSGAVTASKRETEKRKGMTNVAAKLF